MRLLQGQAQDAPWPQVLGHIIDKDDRCGLLEADGPWMASLWHILLQVGLHAVVLLALHDQAKTGIVRNFQQSKAGHEEV